MKNKKNLGEGPKRLSIGEKCVNCRDIEVSKRRSQNTEFEQNAKKFYRQLMGDVPNNIPDLSVEHTNIDSLWSKIASSIWKQIG